MLLATVAVTGEALGVLLATAAVTGEALGVLLATAAVTGEALGVLLATLVVAAALDVCTALLAALPPVVPMARFVAVPPEMRPFVVAA